jgi:GTP-binding protein HflX
MTEAGNLSGTSSSVGGRQKRALIVGCRTRDDITQIADESLEELARLVTTAGAREVARVRFELAKFTAATYIGSGQTQRLAQEAKDADADLIVFDTDLSPTQQRNIEAVAEIMVMDRTGIILDIFASRAQTKEGKLQVELAQLEYLLPRLRGMWTHLSRQGSGVGTRGPGETVLEVDRRRIDQRILRLKKALEKVRKTRALHRKSRLDVPFATAVLIGYTNAGKSTLLNRLTGAKVFVEDKLFATLDPTVRELRLPDGDRVLISDTVGFIRRLPHQLIESFAATFEEIGLADLLLHLVDVSHPSFEDHIETTMEVLEQIDVDTKRIQLVFNKADAVTDPAIKEATQRRYPEAVWVSATQGLGLDDLKDALSERLTLGQETMTLFIPYTAKDAISLIEKSAKVLMSKYEPEGVRFQVRLAPEHAAKLKGFQE